MITESFNDGHYPGRDASIETRRAIHPEKINSNFFSVYDEFAEELWCNRAYSYSLSKGRPWGVYITRNEAMDSTVDADSIFQFDEEKALGLYFARKLVYEKAAASIAADLPAIHGTVVWSLQSKEHTAVDYHIGKIST